MTSDTDADGDPTCGAALVSVHNEKRPLSVLNAVLNIPMINADFGDISCSEIPRIQPICFVLLPRASADSMAG